MPAIDKIVAYFSAESRLKIAPDPRQLENHLRMLPTDWVVWACSLLSQLLARSGAAQGIQDNGPAAP